MSYKIRLISDNYKKRVVAIATLLSVKKGNLL